MNRLTTIVGVVFMALFSYAHAQDKCPCEQNFENGWCWGANPDLAKEKNAFYTDAFKAGRMVDAVPALEWLVENTPNLNKSIYVNGAKIFETLALQEKDAVKKQEYIGKALLMYDKRIECFDKEAYVLNRKAFAAYKLLKGERSRYQELLDLYDRAYELNKDKLYDNNLVAYMDVMRRYKAVGNTLPDEVVFDRYFNIVEIMDVKGDVSQSIRETVDKLLLSIVPEIDCEIVINNFGPKFEQNPELKMAKKIFQLMLTGKCTEHPLAMKTGTYIQDREPNYGISKFLAITASANGDKDAAIRYFEEALTLTDENVKKAEVYLSMARIKGSQGAKSSARSLARQALAADPSQTDAYRFIGDLYMGSYDGCKGGQLRTKDRAIFIAAYGEYRKAGYSAGMQRAKNAFPSNEEIFTEGFEKGQAVTVGCWINESVIIDTRD